MIDETHHTPARLAAQQLQYIGTTKQQIAQRKDLHAHFSAGQPATDQHEQNAKTQQMHAEHAKDDGRNHEIAHIR
ncbi:hypothetical protein [Comamonas testosteroni]|uniref:hypothetical protein n=1 Tax=Comamonas testosteroni TaxID=285 RepID=UPI001EE71442|nr:hypothetical protein [Comamonas testosteroni]